MSRPVPLWLSRLAHGGLLATALAVIALATVLSLGLADPPRAGPLAWQIDFKQGAPSWHLEAPPGGRLAPRDGALVAEFAGDAASQWAIALAPFPLAPTGDFTLEVAGAAVTPGSATAYGLIFGWQDPSHYSTLLINPNGYAEAYRQSGPDKLTWFTWQQWPHILVGPENNRLRVDVRGQSLTLRVNDEIVAVSTGPVHTGQVGLAARTAAPPSPASQVIFSWVKLWTP